MKFKRKKTRKQRGSTFHGWGKGANHHKGAGNRGGRGRAGTGKKADQKKPSYWEEPVGKHGFTSKSRFKIKAINISEIEAKMPLFIEKGFAIKKDKGYELDLSKAGFDKLLALGEPSSNLFVICDYASKSAVAKIKATSGDVKVNKVKVKKQKKKPADKVAKKVQTKKDSKESDEE
jgi:large subunit ribosomal protein L15